MMVTPRTSCSGGSLLLTGLVNCGALGDAVVVTLPYDDGVGREGEQTLDGFSVAG